MYYFTMESSYRQELEKINKLESKYSLEKEQLDFIRAQTKPCQVGDFNSPRSCYIESGYQCSWNDPAKRCDQV